MFRRMAHEIINQLAHDYYLTNKALCDRVAYLDYLVKDERAEEFANEHEDLIYRIKSDFNGIKTQTVGELDAIFNERIEKAVTTYLDNYRRNYANRELITMLDGSQRDKQ